jgi:hypothetical protein
MRTCAFLALVALAAGGCEITRAINTCPAPLEYSPEFQAKAADELDQLPPGSAIGQMIVDYGQERAALRACRK